MNSEKRTVMFRVDGSSTIGFGHIFRCLAMAEMLMDDFNCVFVSRIFEPFIEKIITEKFSLHKLSTQDNKHCIEFTNMLSGKEIVVFDNYFFTTDYQQKIKDKGCKLVCIDDIHDKHFISDIVINHADGIEPTKYSLSASSKLLLGYKYAMLRSEFLQKAKQQKIEKTNRTSLLICIGGTDPHDLIKKITNVALEIDEIKEIHLISKISLELLNNPSNKTIHKHWALNAEELSSLMSSCTFGIFPASTIAIEASACRLPFVAGWFVDNQKKIYKTISDNGMSIGIGNFNSISGERLRKAYNQILKPEILNSITSKQLALIDGNSGKRIKQEFEKLQIQ